MKRAARFSLHSPVYQALLTRRYLTSKVMPLLASLAVVLCTAMVLVVWSVMGGFLAKLVNSGRTLVGDVVITWPTVGFPYYDDLVTRLEADPEIAAAMPMIETYGQARLPDGTVQGVILKGIDGEKFARVTDYGSALWWRPLESPVKKDTAGRDLRLGPAPIKAGPSWAEMLENGYSLTRKEGSVEKPAAVLGIEVSGFNRRQPEGIFDPMSPPKRAPDGSVDYLHTFMPQNGAITLSVFPQDTRGGVLGMESRTFPVANEFHSGLFEVDHRTVLVNFEALQALMKMNAGKRVKEGGPGIEIVIDPDTGEEKIDTPTQLVDEPARATTVVVRAKADTLEGDAARAVAKRCRDIYAQFAAAHKGEVPDPSIIRVSTWEDQNRTFIAAVKKETGLVLTLFCFISLTAVFLVLAIFWSMVSEKTKDIGTLRAIGAGRSGVAGVWLSYGLAIGLVGSILGGVLAYTIVTNINPIHEWMGRALGIMIWDPRIYYFSEIPSKVDPVKMAYVLAGGLLSSVLGALIPAVRAAWMDPVRALRFE